MAGAGSSAPSITVSTSSGAGPRRRSAIAGRRSSRSARACVTRSVTSRMTSRGGLRIRCDWKTTVHRQCVDQRGEVAGDDDHAVVRGAPEGNRVIERFMRTLKEECLPLACPRNRRHYTDLFTNFRSAWPVVRGGEAPSPTRLNRRPAGGARDEEVPLSRSAPPPRHHPLRAHARQS